MRRLGAFPVYLRPIILSGCLFVALSLVLALVMPEQHFVPAARVNRTSFQQMGQTLHASVQLIRVRPTLLTIMGIVVCANIFSAGFDRLWSYHLLAHFTFPTAGGLTVVVWFGIVEAGINVANLVGTEIARRRVDQENRSALVWALFWVDALTLLLVVGFTVAGQFSLALGLFWLAVVARSPRDALATTWMNMDLHAGVRATVFSMRAQVGALAGIAGGPILGALATDRGTGVALVAASAALAPALALYRRTLIRGEQVALPDETSLQSQP